MNMKSLKSKEYQTIFIEVEFFGSKVFDYKS